MSIYGSLKDMKNSILHTIFIFKDCLRVAGLFAEVRMDVAGGAGVDEHVSDVW